MNCKSWRIPKTLHKCERIISIITVGYVQEILGKEGLFVLSFSPLQGFQCRVSSHQVI